MVEIKKLNVEEIEEELEGDLDDGASMVDGVYVEPGNYFPEEVRKEFGLGEYAKKDEEDEM